MRNHGLVIALVVAAALPSGARALPLTVTFAGELTDNAGRPVTGEVELVVSLYAEEDPATAPNALWEETETDVLLDADGRFVVVLGDTTPFGTSLASADELWVGVCVSEEAGEAAEMEPRIPLAAVPYAIVAGDAATLGGVAPDALARVTDLAPYLTEEELEGRGCAADVAQVCRSGSYEDLEGKPDLAAYLTEGDIAEVCITGDFARLRNPPDLNFYATRASLAEVCLAGTYESLLDAPDPADYLPRADIQDVCETGSYLSLTDEPDIGALEADLWCRTSCLRAPTECHAVSCDGAARTCVGGAELPDGTVCKDGIGRCIGGVCVGAFCGKIPCPYLEGYTVACNAQDHCEYTPREAVGWKRWDVWIYVPPGKFKMGAATGEVGSDPTEFPQHNVFFAKGYFIMKFEVVVQQYEACQADGACPTLEGVDEGSGWGINRSANGRQHHPQNAISYLQFAPFCPWVIPGGRVPTEAEWEYAATGPTHRVFPWGDEEIDCQRAVFDDTEPYAQRPWACTTCTGSGCSGTQDAGTLSGEEGPATPARPTGASYVGAMDMAGSLFEWVQDVYHGSYSGAPTDGSAWLSPVSETVILRGGSFQHTRKYDRLAYRNGWNVHTSHEAAGGRCVRPLP